MTAPLHHINQLYLHLPTINGQVAAQAAIGQELQRLAQQAQDKEYRRDLVEVVAETGSSAGTVAINRDGDPLTKSFFREKPKTKPRVKSPDQDEFLATDPLVDVRV
jgi:hypothetical protein